MTKEQIDAVIAEYVRHGWVPRRWLSSSITPDDLELDLPVIRSAIDAIWFARRSEAGRETWELRRLSGTPYALLAFLRDDMSQVEKDAELSRVETEMRDGGSDIEISLN